MVAILWLVLIVCGALAAVVLWEWIPALVVVLVVAAATIWVLISTLSPAVPNRECPRCGEQGLVKIRRGEPGVRCERCDFRDETLHVAYLDDW